jgi:transcriptional regulator with XRE-family HTH domain
MKMCAQCGASGTALTRSRLATYETSVLGYSVVLVNAVDQYVCDAGHTLDVVANQEGLAAAVGVQRVQMPYKLYSAEIRRLRMAMGLRGTELAKRLSTTAESVSRWENGSRMGEDKERTFRVLASVVLGDRAPLIRCDLQEILTMSMVPIQPAQFPAFWFEMVRIKHDQHKDDQWDTTTREAA